MLSLDRPMICLDIEGDGNPSPEIVELAIGDLTDVGVEKLDSWILDPGRPMNPYAIRVHGLRDRDVAGAPRFEDIAAEVHARIDGRWMIGHGIGGDAKIIERKLPDVAIAGRVDTLKIARFILPGRESYRLHDLGYFLGLPQAYELAPRGEHSAAHDTLLAGALFQFFVEHYEDKLGEYLRSAGIWHAFDGQAPRP